MKTELFVIPVALINNSLHVLVTKEPNTATETYSFPNITLRQDLLLHGGLHQLLRETFVSMPQVELENWIHSPRCKDRIVEAYDRDLLFEQVQSVAIVRAIAVSQDFCRYAKGAWFKTETLFAEEEIVQLSLDSRLFLSECLHHLPLWIKNTTFTFELLPQIFSIQDLRTLVSVLANHEIDPGNFHRRLKKLNILHPLAEGRERVHKWELAWEKSNVLQSEGLVP